MPADMLILSTCRRTPFPTSAHPLKLRRVGRLAALVGLVSVGVVSCTSHARQHAETPSTKTTAHASATAEPPSTSPSSISPPRPTISLSPTAGPPGTAVSITVIGCPPAPAEPGGRDGRFEDSAHTAHGPAIDFPVAQATSGTAHATFSIPPSATPGRALVEVVCSGPGNAVSYFEVRSK